MITDHMDLHDSWFIFKNSDSLIWYFFLSTVLENDNVIYMDISYVLSGRTISIVFLIW
jgi:hypothetical protein